MERTRHAPRGPFVVTVFALLLTVPASAEYQLLKTAFSGGAVETSGSGHALRGTVGEAGVVGLTSGGSYVLREGFWSAIYFLNATDAPVPESVIEWANSLSPSFPNPFRTEATIVFTVAKPSPVKLVVYDIGGRRVATLVDEVRLPGRHRVMWSGRNETERRIASGVYFCRFEIGAWSETRRMLRLR